MTVKVVIPIKRLENAKQRLSGLLSEDQRKALFQAMVEDVLEAASSCDLVDEVVVITNDETVASLAYQYSADVMAEPEAGGLIEAVTHAGQVLADSGVTSMVFLPGDIPLVSVEELEIALTGLSERSEPSMTIVPAHDFGGSNCVVTTPPNCMTFAFGEDSCRKHLEIARTGGVESSVARLPGIGLDIDTPEDLVALAWELESSAFSTNTKKFLQASGILPQLLEGEPQRVSL